MSVYDSAIWMADLDRVIESNPCISELQGKTVMITGIGGLVCSSIADILIRYNEVTGATIDILAAARSEAKIKKRFFKYADRSYFKYVEYDATKDEIVIPGHVDYIIHGASNSSPDMIIKEPVETMLSNINGIYQLLNYAKNNAVKRLLYISSSEVYGQKEGCIPFSEEQYGYVDLLNSRSSYAMGKRAAETMSISYANEYGVESVIIRPGHIYGPVASADDKHISSQWAHDAANGKDIVMKSDGAQLRSYCYCLDAASATLTVLIKGENNGAYNISNPDSVISIREMAEKLAGSAGVQVIRQIPTDSEKKGFNPMSNSSLDSSRLIGLGWKACFDANEGIDHTIHVLQCCK